MSRRLPLLSALLRAWLTVAFVAAGASCTSVDSADPQAWQLPQAMVLSPGWVTGTTWPAETVVALRSVALRGTALVDGDLTVITAGTGPFLSGTSELSIATNAEVTGNVRADSIEMQVAGHILGTAAYNQLTGSGTVDGAKTPSLTTPVPRTVVAAVNFTAGTSNVTVNAGSTSTQGNGSYGTFDVKTGTAAARSLLRIRSGAKVNVNNILLGDFARIECLGPCEIRVKNRIAAGPRSYIGPASGQTMDAVKLFVEGANGGAGPNDLPAAAAFGLYAELKAHTFVPNGTLAMGASSSGVGKFIARDVDVGTDAELMSGSSAQRVQALRYVVGPSWPSQTLLAWNSLDILSSTSLTGDGAVLQNGTGPFLNTSEAVIGTTATLTGNLSADRVELKSGSQVSGTVRYNTIVNAGMAGALVTPVTLPLDLRVPVFPNVTTNSTNYTLAATVDATLAAGRFRNVTLTSGTSTNKSILTLSGGLYEMRTLTLGSNCSIVCTAACELRVSKSVVTGDASSFGPSATLDVSKVKLFVSQSNTLPTSTPFAISFGTNNQIGAFVFAPAGTLEAKGGSSVRGRFVAKDIRVGSGSVAELAGATLIAPSISQQPASVTVLAGQPATFSVVAAGSDVAFQWLRGGMPIAGATGGSYTIPATAAADRGAVFTVTVSNSLGSVTSSMATLTVNVCDPAMYPTVATSCGVGACQRMGTSSCVAGLIVNTCLAGTPAATDATCNGIDEDCDGLADDGYLPLATTCAVGACAATGVTSCVAGMVRNSCTSSMPAANDATCDNRDDDCDGRTDENFPVMATTCGQGACAATGVTSCVGGAAQDSCEPDDPGSSDSSCNGIDDDCNGEVDDDYDSAPTSCGMGACAQTGTMECVAGDEVDTCEAGTNAPNDATCDGVDDDCDGRVDENYAPLATSCGVGACGRTGVTSCVAGSVANSCVAGTPAANDALCNGIDDDCSGTADEDYAPVATSCGVGACGRTGVTSCVAGSVANSCVAGTPAASDATCNNVDDDCSGTRDEDYMPLATSCGVGACGRTGATSCVAGSVANSCVAGTPAANDALCNGIDDDCSGTADEDYVSSVTSCGVGACVRSGATSCVAGSVANSCVAGTPAASDATCNNVDDDCSGTRDEDYVPFATSCGQGACARTGVTSCVSGAEGNSCVAGTPAANDATCNDIDDDCNGTRDEDYVSSATSCGVGACVRSGATSCVAGSVANSCVAGTPAASDATCNNVDDDCSGTADEDYAPLVTNCGVGACVRSGATSCVAGSVANSCVAGAPAANDATCNNIDDDCSGTRDEDYAPLATSCGVGACVRSGATSCVAGNVANSCVAGAPAASDATCNNVDEDCSGTADEDYAPLVTSCGVGACLRSGATSCVSGSVANSCVAGAPAANDSLCNGVDDDCSGTADEDFAPSPTSCGVGACARSGATSCVAGTVANSCVAGTPAANDALCNGIDDDCSGAADEDYAPSATSCGVGACLRSGVTSCVSGGVANSCVAGTPAASDATCNGTDDDCSGAADEDYVSIATSCGVGTCSASGATSCVSGSVANSCVVPTTDTDLDGTPNCADGCPTDAAKVAPGGCGCGLVDLDSDSDSALDCVDACPFDAFDDIDGDGLCGEVDPCPVEPENDVDGDGLCPALDNCPNVANPDQLDADHDGAGDACDALHMLALSTGGDHTCALMQLGGVRCWGGNSFGQLGNGTTIATTAPTAVSGLTDASQVSAGFHHSCALRANQQVACWGEGATGRLGNGASANSSVPVTVSGLSDAVEVDAARDHSCARRATGQVVCWGANASGQLGNATTTSSTVPVAVSGLTDAVQLAVGQAFSCARRSTGALVCWGRGDNGQLGRGTITNSNVPVPVTGIADAAELAAGDFHACARRTGGEVRCWGYGANGQIGDGFTTTRRSPVVVSTLSGAVELDLGRLHSCARLSSGELRCWGDNAYGQLGNGSVTSATTPSAVSGISDAVEVSAGDLHTCARRANFEVLCWGQAVSGQLGQGGGASSATASSVAGISNATEVTAGSFHSCARRANGSASCWGPNQYGELGTGTGVGASVPAAVFGLSDALSIAAGDTHSCAVRSGGGAVCWGYGGDGALGNGATDDALAPVAVSGLSDAATISAGNWHSCAVRDGGSVACWGVGGSGELGDGALANSSTPVTVAGLTDAVYVAGGGAHSCALRATGAVVCWGYDGNGQLGNGPAGNSGTPVPVAGITDGVWISAGSAHSCVVHATGAVSCWGANWEGQLGDNSKLSRTTPVAVFGLSDALQVDAGSDHTCALRANGSVVCWGANADRQLGNGTTTGSQVPVTVVGLANAVSVSAGYSHSCGVSASGVAKCWGDNSSGQLGNGYPQSPLPVRVSWP